MSPTEKDYERVGRWLDGEEVQLTDLQRALAEEIAAAAQKAAPALEVELPPGTLHRVHMRLAQAARPASTKRWWRWASAAAAAMILAAGLWMLARAGGGNGTSPQQYVETFLQAPADQLEARMELLADEMADCHMALSMGDLWPLEMALQGLEEEMGQFNPGGFESDENGQEDPWEESLW